MESLKKLYEITAFGELLAQPGMLLMLIIGVFLLFLGIRKKYEPLLLVPIGFGVLLANLPGAGMGIVAEEMVRFDDGRYMTLLEIA